jgi:hypothetical protein
VKLDRTTVCLPIKDRLVSHAFYTALGFVTVGEMGDDGAVILPKDRDTRFTTRPPRGNADRLRSSAPCSVVGRVRGARVAVLRVRAAVGPAAAPGDRAGSGVDARRDHHDPVAIGRRPCHGCGPGAERSSSSRGIRCWPGRGSSTCRRSRARCCGLRDQGRACGRTRGETERAGRLECRWQREQLPDAIRELILDDQRLRNEICWSVFDC